MQQPDDQPPVSFRPSLLSAEQQAEADRLRARAKAEQQAADGSSADPVTNKSAKRSKTGWIAAGAAAVALCAGAGVWVANEEHKPVVAASVAASAAAAAASAGSVASAAAVASKSAPDADVSVAAILNEPVGEKKHESLTEMLSAPSKGDAAPERDPDELSKLLETTPGAEKLAAKKAARIAAREAKEAKIAKAKDADIKLADKPARAKTHEAHAKADKADKADKAEKAQEQKLAARKKESARLAAVKTAPAKSKAVKSAARTKADEALDDDVALLTALVAHSHRETAARNAAQRKLKQCKTLGASEAEQCRVRVCAATAKEVAECKPARLVKSTSNS